MRAALAVAVVAAVVWYVVDNVAEISDVWRQITAMSGLEVLALAAFGAWNLVTYWLLVVAATPGLTYPQAIVLTESTTAVSNTMPAGSAIAVSLSYSMLGSWGFSRSRATLSVVVSGLWNNFAKLGLPMVALVILALQGDVDAPRLFAAASGMVALVVAVAVFALILRGESLAARAGQTAERWVSSLLRLVGRSPAAGWDHAVLRFRSRVIGLVRARWRRLTFVTLVSHVSLFAVLLVAMREVGIANDDVPWDEALAVFAFARLLTALPITPGGVGLVELALIGGLIAAGGDDAKVVAAVLLYRALTYLAQIPLGLATYLFWRRNRSWLNTAPPLPATFDAVPVPAPMAEHALR